MSEHPYDTCHLGKTMRALGKAFEFAEKCLPGGADAFFQAFAESSVARSFEGPRTTPAVSGSGIALVLDICDDSQTVDMLLMNEQPLSRKEQHRIRWCGELLARLQWDSNLSFRAISGQLGPTYLKGLYDELEVMSIEEAAQRVIELLRPVKSAVTHLAYRRRKAGLSQSALSEASGVSLRAIQQYEQRRKDINRARALSIHLLAQVLECHMEDLLEV